MAKCKKCEEAISEKRQLLAYSRGMKPTFCSERCKNAWHARERQRTKRAAAKQAKSYAPPRDPPPAA